MESNRYRNLNEQIHVPAGLNERVLQAAENQQAAKEKAGPFRRRRGLLRAAVCTACAVALVAGTLTLRPVGDSRTPEDGETVLPGFTFGLTAYAADTGESIAADASGTLTFQSGGAVRWGEGGCYTDFLFQVTGEGAKTVSLTLDRGEFYRWNQQTWDRLGAAAEEAYDPAACYGFWVPGGSDDAQKEGTQAALEASLAALDGARLTVTVSFASGEVETKRYELHAEQSTLVARPLQSAQTAADRFCVLPYGGDQTLAAQEARRGIVTFSSGNWAGGGENGTCVSQVFCVQGENIATISASLDRGAFWRGYAYVAEDEDSLPDGSALAEEVLGDSSDIQWSQGGRYLMLEWPLENGFVEKYDPRFCYGLRILPEEEAAMEQAPEYQSVFHFFDGAELRITVTFTDGTEETQVYRLETGIFAGTLDENTGLFVNLTEADATTPPENLIPGIRATRLDWPAQTEDLALSFPFGTQWKETGEVRVHHDGIDIPAAEGTPVLAAADGTVSEIGFDPKLGNYLVLDHGGGLTTLYGQCRNLTDGLQQGDTVRAGEMIAAAGSTGMSTGAHLHFEVRQDGTAQDPVAYFDREIQEALSGE
nr:M23 family metallopeptidase [uncultured Oscillibacter sp.]